MYLKVSVGLKLCADIKDCLLVKSFAFENSSTGIQEVYFLSGNSAVNLIVQWCLC